MTTKTVTVEEFLELRDADRAWERYKVEYPTPIETEHWLLESFDIEREGDGRFYYIAKQGPDRDPGWGTFTRLLQKHPDGEQTLWMSDTRAEILEHSPLLNRLWWADTESNKDSIDVLVNGLGLGMVLHACLTYECVRHVDVVEIDGSLIDLLSPYFDPARVTFHNDDAYTTVWPTKKRWDLAWHDIWPTVSSDNLPLMTKLHRKYGRRVGWQDSWQKQGCKDLKYKEAELVKALLVGDWARVKELDPEF